jgi:hypothetical protein
MFRQVYSNETIPYANNTIPGVIYASDYDLGVVGRAYKDNDLANYSVSTGEYSPWNNGWAYRNDGVDIEASSDNVNTNGYNIGFFETDEWLQYEVSIPTSGVYDIHVRAASGGSGGRMHFKAGNAAITPSSFTAPTGSWQNWKTTIIPNVILDTNDTKIRLYVDQAGFNVSSFEFIKSEKSSTSLATEFVAAQTIDEYNIQMNVNKFIELILPTSLSDFEIFADGVSIPILSMLLDSNNSRIIKFKVDYILKSTEKIKISYAGNQILATDQTVLNNFTLKDIKNTLSFVHQIPVRIQAEDFDFQKGVELETCTDDGGGLNLSYLDPNDYVDYEVNVTKAGTYKVDYRTAAQYGTGGLELQLIDANGKVNIISNQNFSSSGDWQNWKTTSKEVELPVGRYTLRLLITQSPFNLNWVEFTNLSASIKDTKTPFFNFNVFPNPACDYFIIQTQIGKKQKSQIDILSINGQLIKTVFLEKSAIINEQLSLDDVPAGVYLLNFRLEDGTRYTSKLIKANN